MNGCKLTCGVVILVVWLGLPGCGGGSGGSKSSNTDADTDSTYSVGGEVTGTSGSLILQNNGADDLEVSADGEFVFPTELSDGSAYSVTVLTNPEGRSCSVVDGEGVLAGADVVDVDVQCYDTVEAEISYLSETATISWNSVGALDYEVYYSTDADFETGDCAGFSDGVCLSGATSPATFTDLENGVPYFFQVRAVHGSSHATVSERLVARPDILVVNNEVKAMIADDGVIYLGGIFDRIGPRTGAGVPLDMESGGISLPMASYPVVNGDVWVVVSDGSGGFYIGGYFTRVGNISINHMAHILSDGTLDLDFDPNTDYGVSAIAVVDDTVYFGGSFSTVGGEYRDGLAAMGTDGTLLDWAPDIAGAPAAIAVGDDVIYIGGSFTAVEGETRERLAAFDMDGVLTSWSPSANATVTELAVLDDTIYIGGSFSMIGTAARSRLAAIGTDGALKSWDPAPNSSVYVLKATDETLYVGGGFNTIDGQTRQYAAAFDADGVLTDWAPEPSYSIYTVAVNDDVIYLGGEFETVNGEAINYLAAVDAAGDLLPWQPEPDDMVSALAVSGDTIYAGGGFRSVRGVDRSGTAAVNTDGTLASWDPGVGGVYTMAMGDDIIYIGGRFSSIQGETRNRLAAVDLDGELTDWDPNQKDINFFDYIYDISYSDDIIYVGGAFTLIGTDTRNNAAAIDTDGTLTSWNPNLNNSVYALAATSSTVYLGGEFTTLSSSMRYCLAAMTPAGGLYSSFDPEANNSVYTLAISGDTIYAGGVFTEINSSSRLLVAAMDDSGVLSTDWSPSVSGTSVDVLAVSDNTVYIGGEFTDVETMYRNSLAAVGTDGTLLSWDPDVKRIGYEGQVSALSVVDGIVYVGGRFDTVGDEVASNFAIIDADGALMP